MGNAYLIIVYDVLPGMLLGRCVRKVSVPGVFSGILNGFI